MANSGEWADVSRQVLEAVNVEEVYREMGVEVTGSRPTEKGWLACRAKDRDDATPSAAINVGSGPARGRYKDMGGSGESLSLFDFAARYGGYPGWKEARREFAKRAGVRLPSGGEPKRPIDALDFERWQPSVVRHWCNLKTKGVVTPEAVREAGGRIATWPAHVKDNLRDSVIAFPSYGPEGVEADPVGWVVVNITGGNVRLYQGKGKPDRLCKTLCVGGSMPGLLNAYALQHVETAEVIWKVEGLTDMLALHSFFARAGYAGRHVVLTNANGCMEAVQASWVRLLTGKVVYVVGDADNPGQVGAAKWMMALQGRAKEVRNVQLPFDVVDVHGPDVRDFLGQAADGKIRVVRPDVGHGAETVVDVVPDAVVAEQEASV